MMGQEGKLKLVNVGDCELDVYCSSRYDRDKDVGSSKLHNTQVWIDGVPYVLCVGEPDEETERLAAMSVS